MGVITKDLGPVSAYAVAVANGYTGTEAEWEAAIAGAAIAGEQAAAAADTAKADAASAKADAETATAARDTAIEARDVATAAKDSAEAAAAQAGQTLISIPEDYTALAHMARRKADGITRALTGGLLEFADGADGLPIRAMTASLPGEGASAVSVLACGKNLFDPFAGGAYAAGKVWKSGNVTVTLQEDGGYHAVSVNGGGRVDIQIRPYLADPRFILPAGTYTFSITGNAGLESQIHLSVSGAPTGANGAAQFDKADKATVTVRDGGLPWAYMFLRFWAGEDFDVTLYVQCEAGAQATAYEPYSGVRTVFTLPEATDNPVIRVDDDGHAALVTDGVETALPDVSLLTRRGYNAFYCEGGSLSLTYQADTKLYVDNWSRVSTRQTAALMALHMDGTAETYKRLMRTFFLDAGAETATPQELTQICCDWYEGIRGNWNGYTTFYQPDVSDVSFGTRGGDNADMVCEPSTDTVAGRDDYAGLPLFAPTDVNWEIDADTLEPIITGVDGITATFERDNPDKLVGVMQMTGWHYRDERAQTFVEGYAEQYQKNHSYCQPMPEGVRVDGTMRPFFIHAKYMGHVVDGKMRCYAGVIPSAWQSHNALQTASRTNGIQYGGGSVLLQSFLILMTRIKYASLTQDGIIQGCLTHDVQYIAAKGEANARRVLLTPEQAESLPVGSGVLIGTLGSTLKKDRGAVNQITGREGAIVTKKESVTLDGDTYTAVYVDVLDAFDTAGNGVDAEGATLISSFHWPCGTGDRVLGNDGQIVSASSAKYPAKLQGIEYSVGAYEVFGDVMLRVNPPDVGNVYGTYTAFTVNRAQNQAASPTENYRDIGIAWPKVAESGSWQYISKLGFRDGVYMPELAGGGSTKFTRDAFYEQAVVDSPALREWLAFASLLNSSGNGGLCCVNGDRAVSHMYWNFVGRPSACANRGGWGASPK